MILLPSLMRGRIFQIAITAVLIIHFQEITGNNDSINDILGNRIDLKYKLIQLANKTEEVIFKINNPTKDSSSGGGSKFPMMTSTKFNSVSSNNDEKTGLRIKELMKKLKSLEDKMKMLELVDDEITEFKLRVTSMEEQMYKFLKEFDNEMRTISQKDIDFQKTLMDFVTSIHQLVGKLTERMEEIEKNNKKIDLDTEINEDELSKEIVLDILYQHYSDAKLKLGKLTALERIKSITFDFLKRYNNYLSFLLTLVRELREFRWKVAFYNAICIYIDTHQNHYNKDDIGRLLGEIQRDILPYANGLTCENDDIKLCPFKLEITMLTLRMLKLQWSNM